MSLISLPVRTNSTNFAPIFLRLGLGSVFIGHGAQKLFGAWGGNGFSATAKFFEESLSLKPGVVFAALAGGGEFLGGILIVIGLLTRLAAIQAAVIMGVAIWTVHSSSFFAPAGMEYPLTLLLVAISLVITGGGALSLDACLAKPSKIEPKK